MKIVIGCDHAAYEMKEAVKAKLPDSVELTMLRGGQPVYYFIIAVE